MRRPFENHFNHDWYFRWRRIRTQWANGWVFNEGGQLLVLSLFTLSGSNPHPFGRIYLLGWTLAGGWKKDGSF